MSFRPHALALSIVVAGLTLAGCGEDDILSPQQIALTCNTTAQSICDRLKRCGVEYRFARDYGNEQGCIALEKGRCERQLARPKSAHTPKYLDTCAAARRTQTCADFMSGAPLPACDTPKGPLKDGEICTDNAQCVSTFCEISNHESCGKCAQRRAMGGACDGNGDCLPELYCERPDPAALMGTCAKRPVAGEACNDNRPCLTGLDCRGPNMLNGLPVDRTCRERTGKVGDMCNDELACLPDLNCVGFNRGRMQNGSCTARVAMEGAPCDRNNGTLADCDGNLGLYCHGVEKVCKRREYLDPGGACSPNFMDGRIAECNNGGQCQRLIDPITMMRPRDGLCVADVASGMPCNLDDGPGCQAGLSCVVSAPGARVGTCKFRDYAACIMTKK